MPISSLSRFLSFPLLASHSLIIRNEQIWQNIHQERSELCEEVNIPVIENDGIEKQLSFVDWLKDRNGFLPFDDEVDKEETPHQKRPSVILENDISVGEVSDTILRENCLLGNYPAEWDVNGAGDPHIQGFAQPFSVIPEEEIHFKVKISDAVLHAAGIYTLEPRTDLYRVDIYRLGYYGGRGGRKVAQLTQPYASPQPECFRDQNTLLVDCGKWRVSAAWKVPQNAVSGVYIARFVRTFVPTGTDTWRADASFRAASPLYGAPLEGGVGVVNGNTNSNGEGDDVGLAPVAGYAKTDSEMAFGQSRVQEAWDRRSLTEGHQGERHNVDFKQNSVGARPPIVGASPTSALLDTITDGLEPEPNHPFAKRFSLVEPYASLAYFVIRRPAGATGDITFQTSDATWYAYNVWDSPNTYGRTPSSHFNFTEWWREELPRSVAELKKKVVELPVGEGVGGERLPGVGELEAEIAGNSTSSGSSKSSKQGKDSSNTKISTKTSTKEPDLSMKNVDGHSMRAPAPRTMATKKSYNTPMITRDLSVYNSLFNSEYPMIRFLEAQGYDVGYISGADAHVGKGTGRLFPSAKNRKDMKHGGVVERKTKVFLSVGHDEYWSSQQRENVEELRDSGVHLGFFSGNEVYWNIRWEGDNFGKKKTNLQEGKCPKDAPTCDEKDKIQHVNHDQHPEDNEDSDPPLPTTMVTYKDSQSPEKRDPHPALWTGTFRDDRGINHFGAMPENSLTGTAFTVNALRNDPLLVPYRYSKHRFWRHTELQRSLQFENQTAVLIKGLLGHEFSSDWDNGFRPDGLMRLSETTIRNVHAIYDYASALDSATVTHHLVLHKKQTKDKSGNKTKKNTNKSKSKKDVWIFGAGTCQWSWGLDPFHDRPTGTRGFENEQSVRVGEDLNAGGRGDINVQQATINLFADMGVQPRSLLVESMGLIKAKGIDGKKGGGSGSGGGGGSSSVSRNKKFMLETVVYSGEVKLKRITDWIKGGWYAAGYGAGGQNSGGKALLTVTFGDTSNGGRLLSGVEVRIGDGKGDGKKGGKDRWRPAKSVSLGKFEFEKVVSEGEIDIAGGGVSEGGKKMFDLFFRGIDDYGNIEDPPKKLEVVWDPE